MSIILHPTEDEVKDFTSGYYNESDFYYKECEIGNLYDRYVNFFKDDNIIFLGQPDIRKFTNFRLYTPFTYKFNFYISPIIRDINDTTEYYTLTDDDYKIFAKLFLIDGWEEEFIYTFSARETKNINKNSNFGEICCHTKSWVDYITFQESRIILQFRFDDYLKSPELRKEKLNKLKKV
jgi:hypothetical protein